MALQRYLAMTEGEFSNSPPHPWRPAWMACHFSPYDSGLTNLPRKLPTDSLLILNDRIPPLYNDIERIYATLEQFISSHHCSALLLDFQQEDSVFLKNLVHRLLALPCPVIVSVPYAKEFTCPVFLPPVPLLTPIHEYISPWYHREIWLEAALCSAAITVDTSGSKLIPIPYVDKTMPFHNDTLLCHYKVEAKPDCGIFQLQRTRSDLKELLTQAETLGVHGAVGLWQELK